VRVGDEDATAADYVIEDHEDIGRLLDLLLALLPGSSRTELMHRGTRRQ
jgi:hypothetical protein